MAIFEAGQNIGPYRIIEQIGKGGMATVYKAYHASMDRYVAIKILPHQFAESEEFLARFQQEVRTIARLEHPHILPVYDSGEYKGTPYLVMRYMDTGTLKERLQTKTLTTNEIDHLFTQLAQALDYAHSHSVIHRDIKPSNVLVNELNHVFLTDFGVAKLVDEATQLTASGAITGTPAYMSPEQAQGEKLDQRSDIYSLGIVLYEMVTGRVPFEAETPLAVILKQLQAPLPPPTTVKPDLDPTIERVLLKALAKDREERFSSVDEFLEKWKSAVELVEDKTTSAPPVSKSRKPSAIAIPPKTKLADTGIAPTQPEPAQTPETRRRQPTVKERPGWLIPGVIGVIALLVLGVIGLFSLLDIDSPGVGTAPTEGQPSQATPAAGIPPATSETGGVSATQPESFNPEAGSWESWTGANQIYFLTEHEGRIYAGGPGGISVWDSEGNHIRQITTQDGLPTQWVNAVHFDDESALWIGTEEGIARVDGQNVTIYNEDDGLYETYIRDITHFDNFIIAATQYSEPGGGILIFDGNSWERAPNFDSADPEDEPDKFSFNVTSLLVDPQEEGIWVGTENGLGFFDGENWERFTMEDGLPDDYIHTMAFDNEGNLMVATDSGAVFYDGDEVTPLDPLQEESIYGLLQDSRGLYWFAGDGGVWRFNPETSDWQFFSPDSGQLPDWSITDVIEDKNGYLYFGTESQGLVRFRDGEFKHLKIPNIPEQTAFWGILRAPEGGLWFLEEYGLNIDVFNPENNQWREGPEIPCCLIPFAFDAEGNLWGGGDTGLWIVSRNQETNLTTQHGLPSDEVRDIAFSQDGVTYVATDAGLVQLEELEPVNVLTSDETGFESDSLLFVHAASDGSLWVGSTMGLSRMTPAGDWEHYNIGNPFSDSFYRVMDIAEDSNGTIWLATSGDGAYSFQNGNWTHYSPTDPSVNLPSVEVNTVNVVSDGSIWFGTTRGAAQYNGQTWISVNLSDGLIHPNVNAVYLDEHENVWFATSGGITRFTPGP